MSTKKLIEGFERFRRKNYETGTLMEKLAQNGAHPDFFIINCIDPRNGADLVFDAEPGQQFIHSQMAAIIPPYTPGNEPETSASLSYAIDSKKIKHLIIMGHSECGGCQALVDGTSDHYIDSWVKTAEQAKKTAQAKVGTNDNNLLWRETERQVLIMSYQNIIEYPMVKQALKEGRLTVSAWLFDLKQGTLNEYDAATKTFKQLNILPSRKGQRPQASNKLQPPGFAA